MNGVDCFAPPAMDFPPVLTALTRVSFKRRDGAQTVEIRLDEPSGIYKGLRVFVFDELRAPYQTEWKVFHDLRSLGNFVAVCYSSHRALDVLQNYLTLERGQSFTGGVCVFKGSAV